MNAGWQIQAGESKMMLRTVLAVSVALRMVGLQHC